MRKLVYAVFLATVVSLLWSLVSPQAKADHDLV